MATVIPDTMPQAWLTEGAVEAGTPAAKSAEIQAAMDAAYAQGLKEMGVDHIMGRLQSRCLQAASAFYVPPEVMR